MTTGRAAVSLLLPMETLAPNVYKVVIGDKFNNVHLITGSDGAVFFDSGHDTQESHDVVTSMWDTVGRPLIRAIVVSHWHEDHSGGARKLSDLTGAPLFSGPRDKPGIEYKLPGTIIGHVPLDGERLNLGGLTLIFIHTPGHTHGSLSVLYEEEGILFTGDFMRTTKPFSMDPTHGAMSAQRESLKKIQQYDIRMITPGHGPPVDDAKLFISNELQSTVGRNW